MNDRPNQCTCAAISTRFRWISRLGTIAQECLRASVTTGRTPCAHMITIQSTTRHSAQRTRNVIFAFGAIPALIIFFLTLGCFHMMAINEKEGDYIFSKAGLCATVSFVMLPASIRIGHWVSWCLSVAQCRTMLCTVVKYLELCAKVAGLQ
jgi:hypothetical protein